jgi:hypothetical protein
MTKATMTAAVTTTYTNQTKPKTAKKLTMKGAKATASKQQLFKPIRRSNSNSCNYNNSSSNEINYKEISAAATAAATAAAAAAAAATTTIAKVWPTTAAISTTADTTTAAAEAIQWQQQ